MDQNFTPEEFAAEFSPRTITGFFIDVYNEKAEVVTIPASMTRRKSAQSTIWAPQCCAAICSS